MAGMEDNVECSMKEKWDCRSLRLRSDRRERGCRD